MPITRRKFLETAGKSTALIVGYTLLPGALESRVYTGNSAALGATALNAFIKIDASNTITLFAQFPEMGQGVLDAIPMLIAEELEVDWSKIKIETGETSKVKFGDQMAGGSGSVSGSWESLRKIGATARETLIEAASRRWNVNKWECYAENGTIVHRVTMKVIPYGELVKDALKMEPPKEVSLKKKSEFRILGRAHNRKDATDKVNGKAIYGIDLKIKGMLYASVERCPLWRGTLKSFNAEESLKIPRVRRVIRSVITVFDRSRESVAVVGDNFWSVTQGRKALKVEWDFGEFHDLSTEKIFREFRAAGIAEGNVINSKGDFTTAISNATKIYSASYETPFQAHASMEPVNCIVSVKNDSVEFWGGTQAPNHVQNWLAKFAGIKPENVKVNFMLMGGSFGRKALSDYVLEAAYISREMKAPIKIVWSREDDTTQGPFRPGTLNILTAGLDKNGKVIAFQNKLIGQDIWKQRPGQESEITPWVASAAIDESYDIPNWTLNAIIRQLPVPTMWWRAVYDSTNSFGSESFIDELAVLSGSDPLGFRLSLLKKDMRKTEVLRILAAKSKWSSPKAKNEGKGIAIVSANGSICAQVVRVKSDGKKITIKKVVAVIDCGMYVNANTIKAQVEGSIIMGIGAATLHAIHFENGKAIETNFTNYALPRILDTPETEVYIVENEEKPGGIGEPSLPPLAPALANAIFDVTGQRLRILPLKLTLAK